jgi:alkylation response protein AidB-like acyl-CoA dehydrogenase
MQGCTPDAATIKLTAQTMAILARSAIPFILPSFMKELLAGSFRWDLIHPFPRQSPADRHTGDEWVRRLRGVYHRHIHPEKIDMTREFPHDYLRVLKDAGLLTLTLTEAEGGADLSHANLARIYQLSGSWCSPVTLSTAVHNSLAVPAFLPYVRDPATRARFAAMIAGGAITSLSATENQGASNVIYQTTAQPTPDGRHYVLNGEKVYVGNGPLARLFVVPATTWKGEGENREPEISLFVVEADTPGFRVNFHQSYMGMNGLPSAMVNLDDVHVPVENMVGAPGEGVTTVMKVVPPGKLFIPAMALGVMKNCLEYARAFTERKYMGLPLRCYQLTQQQLAAMAAAIFALESVLEWISVTLDDADRDVRIELDVSKTFGSTIAWRVLDSTMSLFAGRGYETQLSLQARGVESFPVERFFRDLRVLRIFGTANELIQLSTGSTALSTWTQYFPPAPPGSSATLIAQLQALTVPATAPEAEHLSPANQEHLEYVARASQRLARASFTVLLQAGGTLQATQEQPLLIYLAEIAGELCAMSLTLSRADTLSGPAPEEESSADSDASASASGATPASASGTGAQAPAGSTAQQEGATAVPVTGSNKGAAKGKVTVTVKAPESYTAETSATPHPATGAKAKAAAARPGGGTGNADSGEDGRGEEKHEGVQELADLFCIHARRRVEVAFAALNLPDDSELAGSLASSAVDGSLDWLLQGIMGPAHEGADIIPDQEEA